MPFVVGEDEFRPDITLLVNGMPLAFVEVKKRLNPGGVLEERRRMDRRHANPRFRPFFNLVQLMVFSNNMEYDDGQLGPVQGAFYAASTYGEAHFNYFREERAAELAEAVTAPDEALENRVLSDADLVANKGTPGVRAQQGGRYANPPPAHLAVEPQALCVSAAVRLRVADHGEGRRETRDALPADVRHLGDCRAARRGRAEGHHPAHPGQRENRAGVLERAPSDRLVPG